LESGRGPDFFVSLEMEMKRLRFIIAVLGASLVAAVVGKAIARPRQARIIVTKQVAKEGAQANPRRLLLLGRFESPEQFAHAAVAALRKARAAESGAQSSGAET
jgi:hypothetical protein